MMLSPAISYANEKEPYSAIDVVGHFYTASDYDCGDGTHEVVLSHDGVAYLTFYDVPTEYIVEAYRRISSILPHYAICFNPPQRIKFIVLTH